MFENSNLTTGTVTNEQIMNQCGFRLPCGICTRTNSLCPYYSHTTVTNPCTITTTWTCNT